MTVLGIKPTSFIESPKIEFHTSTTPVKGGPTFHVQNKNIAEIPAIFHQISDESGVNVLSQVIEKPAPPPSVQLGFIKKVHDYFPKEIGPGYIQEGTNSGARYMEALKNTDPALFGVLGDAAWNATSVLPVVGTLTGLAALGTTFAKGGFGFLKTGAATTAAQTGAKGTVQAADEIAARAADSLKAQADLKTRLRVFQGEVQETMALKRDLRGPVADAVRAGDQRPDLVSQVSILENSLIPNLKDAVTSLKNGRELPFSISVNLGPMDLPKAEGMLNVAIHQLAFVKQRISLIDQKLPHLKGQGPRIEPFDSMTFHW